MELKFTRNTATIKGIYDDFTKERLIIDNTYQRRKVWLPQDNIRLIETILLNLIIPEIFLWPAEVNADNGDKITHIVDGQQRINAIIDFVSGKYKLQAKYLLNKNTYIEFSNKCFSDLSPELRTHIWMYNLSIVNIDRNCTMDDIKMMFYRLNLTNYSLNEQEKRNSLVSEFGEVSDVLSKDDFWVENKLFSATDVRRMKDVEYCSNIIILAREGIIDQTNAKKINENYDDLKETYPDKEQDIKLITNAMDIIGKFVNSDTSSFISKKSQMYTMFSLVFNLIENEVEISNEMIEKLRLFVITYNKFKNGMELSFEDDNCAQVYEGIKKYKLASSEGINKVGNRVIRFETLKRICVDSDNTINEAFVKVTQSIDNISSDSINEIEQDESDL